MSFLKSVRAKYSIISDSLGYMSRKELGEKIPDLAKAYDGAYGGKKPDIKIVAAGTFSFPQEQYSQGSWHVIFAVLNGQVKELSVGNYYGKSQQLLPNSMILDCIVGHLSLCYLYVHPQDATPLVKEAEELSVNEYLALSVMQGYKAFAREKEFYEIKYKSDSYKKRAENPNEYKDTLKLLAEKGLVKLSKAGAAQLTLEGKNRALHAGKAVKKLRGY